MPYELKGRVRFSEVDEHGNLSINALVDYFQDASTFQAEDLNIGTYWLKEMNLAWILASWQIVIDHLPRLGDEICASTWAYQFKQFLGMRNFVLYDREGKKAAWANSIWVLYDMKRNQPMRISGNILEAYGTEEKLDMEYAPRKLHLPPNGKEEEGFVIGRQFLDTNHHVNNGQYISMARGFLPDHFEIRELRAEYRSQARLGDEIHPEIFEEEDGYTVSLNAADHTSYAAVKFIGKYKENH